MFRFFRKIIIMVFLLCVTVSVLIYIGIAYHSHFSKPVNSDVMIVLGCQIWGKAPSWSLEYRLNKALELYEQGYAKQIIVSGGQGVDEEATEASVMKAWLVKHGVEADRILEEDKSTSTFENLKFSKNVMDSNNLTSAVIVSSDFHVFRSLILADRLGIKASGAPAPTVPHLKFYYNSREVLSVVKSILLDR